MPTTRKKVIKTVYKDENDSEADNAAGDFSDSGSDAVISDQSSSDEDVGVDAASEDEFVSSNNKRTTKPKAVKKTKFAKSFLNKINKQSLVETEEVEVEPALFSVKDLTEAEKLLPFELNLSESDSSDDETPSTSKAKTKPVASTSSTDQIPSQNEVATEYKDVWSQNKPDDSEAIAKKTFMELEQHKAQLEAIQAKVMDYSMKNQTKNDSLKVPEKEPNVNDLLALGEDVTEPSPVKMKKKAKPVRDDSDSEIEDWEEVKETAAIPQQGLQLFVDFPDGPCRKSKKLDVEMMMKRKINRVKKEHQVYMHKVHVLCWIGHGNYVSQVLNDQDVLAAALSLIPSDECYPGERVDMKYLEQITKWYKDKLTLKQDKHENKFRPKAPPLKELLLAQMKSKVVTTKKYLVFVFVSMLRALGLQCRVMFNFVALPIKPPSSELCSLSTKKNEIEKSSSQQDSKVKKANLAKSSKGVSSKIAQLDGICDDSSGSEFETFMQVDGSDDALTIKTRSVRNTRKTVKTSGISEDDVIPTKKSRKSPIPKAIKPTKSTVGLKNNTKDENAIHNETGSEKSSENAVLNQSAKKTKNFKKSETKKDIPKTLDTPTKMAGDSNVKLEKSSPKVLSLHKHDNKSENDTDTIKSKADIKLIVSPRKTRSNVRKNIATSNTTSITKTLTKEKIKPPEIVINKADDEISTKEAKKRLSLSRKRSQTSNPPSSNPPVDLANKEKTKSRTKSAPGTSLVKSEYFSSSEEVKAKKPRTSTRKNKKNEQLEDQQRVSHKDLAKARTKSNSSCDIIDVIKKRVEAKTDSKKQTSKDQTKSKAKTKNDVTGDLIHIIKKRVEEAKVESKILKVKGKRTEDSGDDSDFLPVESPKRHSSENDDDFKPKKISPRPSSSKKIDRRVLSSDDDLPRNKVDVWCEVFVEELEQWIAVDIVKGVVHCSDAIYNHATHPVCYTVGWDNSNCLKDLTRRYVPHWNTVTRKLRAEPLWWDQAIKPYLGPRTARDREEDEGLDRMQLEAPLPKSIAEYKNHPLYALKRHLLKFEAIYPPDAATLGFVRGEAVYARDCIYTCRSRDTWLKEAKVVRLGEKPYKVVKARPKWDKLSNKLITDKPLEVFGPWQVKDYEPPVAENGMVPRNPYGNVELFKECMLPKGTVHIKLPGLNRVAKKLNVDCAPAMTGFDFNGGWSHPVYDGFVVCQEFEELVTEAWVKDQEEQLRREREKIDLRVYGNWKRLIKGLLIKERLKDKYGFQEPSTSQDMKKKAKKPRLVVKK